MEVDTVLVAVDGSSESTRAAEVAVAVAARYGADVHSLYVLGETEREREEDLMVDVEAVGDGVAMTHSTATGFSTASLRHHPGSVVLDVADEVGADFIVVPREQPGATLGKTAEYVLHYADPPVLSV